jgi:hypothetical protein
MNILVGDNYRITSDTHNVILERKTVGKKGSKNEGQVVWQTDGYFRNLGNACESLLNRRLRLSEAESIYELKQLIQEANREIVEGGGDGEVDSVETHRTIFRRGR